MFTHLLTHTHTADESSKKIATEILFFDLPLIIVTAIIVFKVTFCWSSEIPQKFSTCRPSEVKTTCTFPTVADVSTMGHCLMMMMMMLNEAKRKQNTRFHHYLIAIVNNNYFLF